MKAIDKNKKIRIVSFQNAHNFGAVCQAYGLQQTLLDMGYTNTLFINYNPIYLKDRYNPITLWPRPDLHTSFLHKISRLLRWYSLVLATHLRNSKFNWSIKHMLHQTGKELNRLEEVATEEADVLICGSDQIWNNSLTKTLDSVFFGLASKNYGKVISYAPSTEVSSLTDEVVLQIAKHTTHFSSISVRESSVKERLQPFIPKPIEVCVDPTILCTRQAYERITSKRLVRKPYICVYAYYPDEELVKDVIQSIPDYHAFEIHYILFTATSMRLWINKSIHFALSVEDFLSYIRYASFVVTNSFHGLAFSLIFEKNFMVTWIKNKSSRCEALLNELGLSNRLLFNASDAVWEDIDYAIVRKNMDELRDKSRKYLINSLI